MPSVAEPMSHFSLVLNGRPADKEAMDALLSCTVETTLNLPDMCLLRLHDTAFRWIDSPVFREGVGLQVDVTWEGGAAATLFRGEIVGLEMDLDAHHLPTISVRAYDRSHRLQRGRYSRTFVQMTDADIVQKIGQEAGFTVTATATPIVHDWLMQNNQTNWEFLSDCAVRCGFRLFLKGERELYFAPIDYTTQSTPLEWGKDLIRFRPRVSTAQQVDEVIVRGWDDKTKAPIIGKSQTAKGVPETGGGGPVQGGVVAHQTWGTARHHLVDHPVRSQNEADVLAQSLCDALGSTFLEAEGTASGKATLQPGTWVEIKNIGQRFSGKYFVTTARHVYGAPQKGGGGGGSDGYQTSFQVTGKQPPILLALLAPRAAGVRSGGALGGNIVVGIVTDNNDPEGMGRVKVEYPWLTDGHTSSWARVVSPMAGKGRGFHCLPEIGDEVLVAFEHGAITHPYLLGALWNGKDSTIEPNSASISGGQVNRRMLKTRIGHTLLLDDTDGKGGVEIRTNGGRVVTVSDADQKITVSDKLGNSLTVNTGDNSISLSCNGNFDVTAKGKVSITGLLGVSVTSPAMTNVTGSVVSVTGAAAVNVVGALVTIN